MPERILVALHCQSMPVGHGRGVAGACAFVLPELEATVHSGGISAYGLPPPPEVVSVMLGYELDVSEHRSHQVTAADLRGAQLILGMSREHVRHAAVTAPDSWARSFTLKEIVRRGAESRGRIPGEPLASWLAVVGEGRERRALLGGSAEDDVADPIGGPPRAYEVAGAEIERLVTQLAWLGWGSLTDSLPAQR